MRKNRKNAAEHDLKPNMWADPAALRDSDDLALARTSNKKDSYYTVPLYAVADTMGSDFTGSSVSAANYNSMIALGDRTMVFLHGAHRAYGIALRLDGAAPSDAILAAIEDLEAYPVIDESELSRVEQEREDDAWQNWGRLEWGAYLKTKLGEQAVEEMSNDDLDELWQDATQSVSWVAEHGTGTEVRFNYRDALRAVPDRKTRNPTRARTAHASTTPRRR